MCALLLKIILHTASVKVVGSSFLTVFLDNKLSKSTFRTFVYFWTEFAQTRRNLFDTNKF